MFSFSVSLSLRTLICGSQRQEMTDPLHTPVPSLLHSITPSSLCRVVEGGSPGAVRPNFLVVFHSVASDFPLENPSPIQPRPGSQGGHVSQAWPNTVPVSRPLSGGQRSLGWNPQQGVCLSSRATHLAGGDPTAAGGHLLPCGRAWRVKQTRGSADSTQSPLCLKPPSQDHSIGRLVGWLCEPIKPLSLESF